MATVKQIRALLENKADDEHVAVLFYEQSTFADMAELSPEQWAFIVSEFDDWDGIDAQATEWLVSAVLEHGIDDVKRAMLAEAEPEMACDRCGIDTGNGMGVYTTDDPSAERVCAECWEAIR